MCLNLDFHDTREQVLIGLRSLELCTMLLERTHDDEDDLLHDILEFERITENTYYSPDLIT